MAITAELLVSQVRNTAPYVFDAAPGPAPDVVASPPARFARAYDPSRKLTHFEYFRLCLSAHYLTCATPVPTDVDNQIRKKLWVDAPLETALEMAALVLESHAWDFRPLSGRTSYGAAGSPFEREPLHGHFGEWFTVAVGAYAALAAHRAPEAEALRASLLDGIDRETTRHSEIFGSVWRANDGLGALCASVSIAHNFGDLDRVVDMWDVPVADPLRLRFYKLTSSPFDPEGKLRYQGRLWTAGELYKASVGGSSMAFENHRHFALRKPRALRAHPALRVPLAPFFDPWGHEVATRLEGEALDEVVDALRFGMERMPRTFAYARGLHAIALARPEIRERLDLRANAALRKALEVPREAFEKRWNDDAVAQLDDIPSRAGR